MYEAGFSRETDQQDICGCIDIRGDLLQELAPMVREAEKFHDLCLQAEELKAWV